MISKARARRTVPSVAALTMWTNAVTSVLLFSAVPHLQHSTFRQARGLFGVHDSRCLVEVLANGDDEGMHVFAFRTHKIFCAIFFSHLVNVSFGPKKADGEYLSTARNNKQLRRKVTITRIKWTRDSSPNVPQCRRRESRRQRNDGKITTDHLPF